MTEDNMTAVAVDQETMLEKVCKLLSQAEATPFPAEAEAFTEKALSLMAKWAIDDALLADARAKRDGKIIEKIVEKRIPLKGTHAMANLKLGSAVARGLGLRVLQSGGGNDRLVYFIGFESDVARAELLFASLMVQAAPALKTWARENLPAYLSGNEKSYARRDFLFGFAAAVGERLEENRRAAERDAVAAEKAAAAAAAPPADTDAPQVITGHGTAMVLRDRAKRVDEWVDETYGRLRSTSSRTRSGSGYSYSDGKAAGRAANLGGTSIGSRGQIGGGR